MQPLVSSTIFSTLARPVTTLPSIPTSPISFMMTATGFPRSPCSSTWRRSVVFPLPRKPVRMSTATVRIRRLSGWPWRLRRTIRGSAAAAALPDGCSLLPPAATNPRRASRAPHLVGRRCACRSRSPARSPRSPRLPGRTPSERTPMDFGFSEEQEMLRKSARDFLAKECAMTYVRQMMEDERGFRDEQWQQMAGLGWMGLVLPEEHGGAGLDFVDLIVVLEEMGRVVLPGPFFSTVVLGGVALLEGGSAVQKKELLPKLAAGKLRVTLAQLEPSARWDAEGIALEARPAGGGYKLSGTKLFVPDAHTADLLIVAARGPGSQGAEGV